MKRFYVIAIGIVLYSSSLYATEQLSYIDIINQLTDLERLAVLPVPGEKCAQWSSYDRSSRYDANTNEYINWSANNDGNGIIQKEEGNSVLAEIQGPGVIWRIWTARAGNGRVKIYLDDHNSPAVDLPFTDYFNKENEPFTRPALVHETSRGLNCYIPIPFQRSCKIIAEENWGDYYHFTYSTYPKGTVLPTFSRQLTSKQKKALNRADKILTNCGRDPAGKRAGKVTQKKNIKITPGETVTIAELKGQRAITALKVKINLPLIPDDYNSLRELALSIYWDGGKSPAVWSPLGDFFGSTPGINEYKSLPMGTTKDEFYSYWYMPFEKSALIQLTNDGKKDYSMIFSITHAPLSRDINELGRFHAKWHRDFLLPENPQRREIDWTMLKTEGKGRYCGVMLHVWNPKGGWWGEGDEKFFVDGEKFPSTFGTGTEDYFGYAWCDARPFTNCYHNQTIGMNNRGHISINRWHIADNVPFQKFFEAAMEKYFSNQLPTFYACISYWYLSPDDSDSYGTVPVEERIGYWHELKSPDIPGALEAEELKILSKTGGQVIRHRLGRFGQAVSNNMHLWWREIKIGDRIDLAIPVETKGKYRFIVQLMKSNDHGSFQLYLDDNKLDKPIDLYSICIIPAECLNMGIFELEQGEHKLTIELVDAGKHVNKPYAFGIDYVKLEKIE